jgi:hypothetical protein
VDIETERRQNILDDSKIRAPAGVEDDVEGFETGSLEPSPCGGESGEAVAFKAMDLGSMPNSLESVLISALEETVIEGGPPKPLAI